MHARGGPAGDVPLAGRLLWAPRKPGEHKGVGSPAPYAVGRRGAPSSHRREGPPIWALVCGTGLAALATIARAPATEPSQAGRAASRVVPEYRLKAAFLVQFLNFVRWPESDSSGAVCIGILGQDPFGDAFAGVEDSNVIGRPLKVKRFRNLGAIETCHVLFVSSSERDRLPEVIAALGDSSTLTVGEAPRFTQAGGMIRFYAKGRRIALEVNPAAAERARLKLSAKLLELATLVPAPLPSQER